MDYKNINDYEMIYMIKENEFDKDVLFKKYKPLIERIAKRYYNNNYGFVDIDDIIQEGYIALNKAIDSYNDDVSLFYTFAKVCIERHLMTYVKRLTKVKKFLDNTYSYDNEINDKRYIDVLESNINYPHEDIIKISYLDQIRKIKNDLEPLQAAVFELRFNGFKIREVAQLLDITTSNVNNIIKKIKNVVARSGVNELLINKY